MFARIHLFLIVILCAVCAPREYDRAALTTRLGADASIAPADVLVQSPMEYAVVTSRKIYDPTSFACYHKAPFAAGVVVVARRAVVIYRFADDGKTLEAPLGDIDSYAIASWGMFGHIHQLQLRSKSGTVAIFFGTAEGLPQVREKLAAIGIKQGQPIGRVVVPVGAYDPEQSC